MMQTSDPPYQAQLFVCTFTREGGRESCGEKGSAELRDSLKKSLHKKARDLGVLIRVNASGCLGMCERGIACALYLSQNIPLQTSAHWWLEIDAGREADRERLENDVVQILHEIKTRTP